MARTITGVRDAIITAITTSSMLSALGLKDTRSILDREIELYRSSERAVKLTGERATTGELLIRAWAVQVLASEDILVENQGARTYTIGVTGYYKPEDLNTMLDNLLKIKEAIKNMGNTLNGTVQTRGAATTSSPSLVEIDDDDIAAYVTTTFSFTAQDNCPEY